MPPSLLMASKAGPLLFAHRGTPRVWPENSLPSLRAALAVGADALEIDVHMTRDGHPVVIHDADGKRCARVQKRIAGCTLAEVQAWDLWAGFPGPKPFANRAQLVRVATLSEVLQALPGAHLNVDLKQARPCMVAPVLALIAAASAQPRVLLTSFRSSTIRRIRSQGYSGPTGLGRAGAMHALLGARWLARRWPPRAARIQIPMAYSGLRLDTGAMIERAHGLGLRVDYWVVNDAAEAERLLDLGADGIVTDVPDMMVSVFMHHARCDGYRQRHG